MPPTTRGRRSNGHLPPIQFQGRLRRENLLRRLRRLEAREILRQLRKTIRPSTSRRIIPQASTGQGHSVRPIQRRIWSRSEKEGGQLPRQDRQQPPQQLATRIRRGHAPQPTQWLLQPHRWRSRWRSMHPQLRKVPTRKSSWSLV